MVVVFLSSAVPRFSVTHSRITVLSPMLTVLGSPLYFRSCGGAETTAPGKIRQFLPMRAPSIITELEPIQVPSPISTSLCMVTKGSITTLSAILACGCIYANGWIIFPRFLVFLLFGPSARLQQQRVRLPCRCPSFALCRGVWALLSCNERSGYRPALLYL